jgi:1-acyl-sn-glycerol-3-phosphate acyltransferase
MLIQDARADRSRIAGIVARESAETLVGAASGVRLGAMRCLLAPAAHLIARRFVEYDSAFGEHGPHRGAEWVVAHATGGLVVTGAEHIPSSGPLLVVANHPGLADAVSLLASMRRDDAWIVTANYPFLRAMRSASRRFLFVDDRCTALRHIVRRLRAGDAVLLFPAGGLEPDPAMAPGPAQESLASWSRSIELIARLAPHARIVPAVVRGAVSRAAYDHRLSKRRAPVRERQRFASLLQLALPGYQRELITVSFGAAISASSSGVQDVVLAAMTGLMRAV